MNTVAVATSVLANALIGGKRYEMLSSRAYRCNWTYVIAVLDGIFGAGHCLDCFHFELTHFDGIQD
jgi:hypothetical protein